MYAINVCSTPTSSQCQTKKNKYNWPMNTWCFHDTLVDMSELFRDKYYFNEDISGWNVSQVTNMRGMFKEAHAFNGNIGDWDVSKVTDMYGMFHGAKSFNKDIGDWDVRKVTNMKAMFMFARDFDGNIGNWESKTSNVEDMSLMFSAATSFNQNIGSWDVSKVTTMRFMFRGATSFDGNIGNWETKTYNVEDMHGMFKEATSFNQDIGGWEVSQVTDMGNMFSSATSFGEQQIGRWEVSNVIYMNSMFSGATSFNGDVGEWRERTSNVERMDSMFERATKFNQNIDGWHVSKVTSMNAMFSFATSFNQDLCNWNDQIGFPYYQSSNMFYGSGCAHQEDPSLFFFCKEFCGTPPIKFVKVTVPGSNKILSLSEVKVFAMVDGIEKDVALARFGATATQSSTYTRHTNDFSASNAIDGTTTGDVNDITHTIWNNGNGETNPWWEVHLASSYRITLIVVWNRWDCCSERLSGAVLSLLDANKNEVTKYDMGDSKDKRRFLLYFNSADIDANLGQTHLPDSFSRELPGSDVEFQREAFDERFDAGQKFMVEDDNDPVNHSLERYDGNDLSLDRHKNREPLPQLSLVSQSERSAIFDFHSKTVP